MKDSDTAEYRHLHEAIRAVIARREDQWDGEGDAWLGHPNPDESYLLVDALTDAVTDAVRSHTGS